MRELGYIYAATRGVVLDLPFFVQLRLLRELDFVPRSKSDSSEKLISGQSSRGASGSPTTDVTLVG